MLTEEEVKNRFSKNLIGFIIGWEGFKSKIFKCVDGFPTIGYGHKIRAVYREKELKETYQKRGITAFEAKKLLLRDLVEIDQYISRNLKKISLVTHQREALISLLYNWGIGNFSKSKIRGMLLWNEYDEAANEILNINKSGDKILPELVKRRKQERIIFLKGWEGLEDLIKKEKVENIL
jgi:lysozyme